MPRHATLPYAVKDTTIPANHTSNNMSVASHDAVKSATCHVVKQGSTASSGSSALINRALEAQVAITTMLVIARLLAAVCWVLTRHV